MAPKYIRSHLFLYMTTSVFTELLSSYDGLRRRTWSPSLVVEAFDPTPQQTAAITDIQAAFKAAAGGQPQQGKGARGNINMVPNPKNPQSIQITGSNVGNKSLNMATFANEFNMQKLQHGSSWARKLLAAWAPQEPETRYGDNAKQGFNGDTEEGGETGIVEPIEDEEEQGPPTAAQAMEEERAQFSEVQRKNITEMYVGQGMSEEAAEKAVKRIEDTINTPHSQTKIYKGLVETMGKRPDLPAEVKQEALDCVAALASTANKIEEITLGDGSKVKGLRAEKLTLQEQEALAITTIRGEGGEGGVYVGKSNIERQPGFTNLQNFTSEYDHSTYGTTFGRALGDSLGPLWGIRVLPTGAEASVISNKEEYDKVSKHSTRQSTSVERRGTGAKSLSNDWKGKLTEDIVELNVATIAGDKAAQKVAMEGLRKRLEAGASFTQADLENLESALLGDEYEGLLDFQRLEALGIPPNVHVRQAILQAAVQTELFFSRAGISKENVMGVYRPSQASEMGYKSDIDIYLKPGTQVSPEFEDCVHEDEAGNLTLSISIKNYGQLQGDTVLGSSSINKSYGTPKPGDVKAQEYQRTADRLHNDYLDRAVAGGHMSDKAKESCRQAVLHDRVSRETLEKQFGSFTAPNRAALTSFVNTMLDSSNTVDFETDKAKMAYEKQLNEIKTHITDGKSGSQFAAIKIWQMQRMVRAQNDPEYGKAVAFNDGVFGAGTFENEAILRGSPGKLTTGKYHDVYNQIAGNCFGPGGSGNITLGASKIVDSDGNNVMDTRITAKNTASGTRKLQAETKLSNAGRVKTTKTEDAIVKEKKSDLENAVRRAMGEDPEEEQEEVLTGSTLYPILQQLPSKETGDIQKVGDKIIVTHLPFCLKVKHNGHEFEGGFPSKSKALKALDLIRQLAKEQGETIDAKVEDYDAGRTLS